MNRPALILFGGLCYVLFNVTFLYLAGFLLELPLPKAINDGTLQPWHIAIPINIGLVFLFGFFHSLMARARFKAWWTQYVPEEAERSMYVLQSSLFLALAMWQWQPMPATLWLVEGTAAAIFYGLFGLGLALVLISTFLIDHFELFGLRQVWFANKGRPMVKPVFKTPFLYRHVRHPMQLGVILVVFSTPHMTAGHLLFASLMTVYILIGLYFEERSLVREFGPTYLAYKARVPMLIPNPFRTISANLAET